MKGTTDFLNKTKDINVPLNSLLVKMDVKSLYTNIPNGEGLSAINNTLKQKQYTNIFEDRHFDISGVDPHKPSD